jgi:putative Holliday junction resolvase
MRTLGLDYGSARCGCALADPTGTVVTPLDVVVRPATRRGLDALTALVAEREVGRVVVGLPLALSGQESEQTRETRRFAARLARRLGEGVPVELHDERFTTRQAQRMGLMGARPPARPPASAEDSRAAALMLESWLSTSTSPSGEARTARRGRTEEGP